MNQLVKRENQLDYILLDGSASMATKWHDSLAAIHAYVDTLKQENVNSDIYLHLFSSGSLLDLVGFDGNISQWGNLMGLELPNSGTSLYDAVAIMGRRMRDFDPPHGRITIVTDGEEGGSQFTDITQAKAILDWCRAKGWPVTFIGVDFSNNRQARALGADKNYAIGVQQKLLSDAARNYGRKAANHARSGTDMGFSESEQQQFGGYLAPPK